MSTAPTRRQVVGAAAGLALSYMAWPVAATEIGSLLDATGKSVSLPMIAAGQPIALVVMKSWQCPVCVDQARRLWAMRERVAATGGRIAIVTDATAETSRTAAKNLKLGFEHYSDPNSGWLKTQKFVMPGGGPLPGLIFLDRCGDVYARWRGRRPGERQEDLVLHGLSELAKLDSPCRGSS